MTDEHTPASPDVAERAAERINRFVQNPNLDITREDMARQLAAIIREEYAALEQSMRYLEKLTPGGSEFAFDPERCFKYAEELIRSGHEAKKDKVREQQANRELAEMLGRVFVPSGGMLYTPVIEHDGRAVLAKWGRK